MEADGFCGFIYFYISKMIEVIVIGGAVGWQAVEFDHGVGCSSIIKENQ